MCNVASIRLSSVCMCKNVGPGPVNSLLVTGENATSFMVSWESPSPSDKNGSISSYYVVATFTSNGLFVRDTRINAAEAVNEIAQYSISFAGLGEKLCHCSITTAHHITCTVHVWMFFNICKCVSSSLCVGSIAVHFTWSSKFITLHVSKKEEIL